MEIISTKDLAPVPRAGRSIYDVTSGTRIFGERDAISLGAIRSLVENGIHKVALLSPGETPEALIRSTQYRSLNIANIRPGMQLGYDIYTVDGSLLLTKGSHLTDSTMERLARRRIREVFVRRLPDRQHQERLRRVRAYLQRERQHNAPPQVQFANTDFVDASAKMSTRTLDQMISDLEDAGDLLVRPGDDAEALVRFIQFVDAFRAREAKTKEYYIQLYHNLIAQTARIYDSLRDRGTVNGQLILAMIDETISALVADRELLLCTIYIPPEGREYLPHHAVNVSIIAVNIAATAGYTAKQVTELGYGALLSDVGMLSVPHQIRFKQSPLSSDEQLEIMRHTLYGIDRLQLVYHLPRITTLVGYQSHERLDGSGYPHGKRARGIHDYAKIVAIADVFHAQVAKRPFRPRGRLPYQAIEEVLRMASARKLDPRFARHLLSAVSLFPVGSWVRLNSGDSARVIAAHRTEFTRPVVNILYDASGRPRESERVDLAKSKSLHVVSPIDVDSSDPMEGF